MPDRLAVHEHPDRVVVVLDRPEQRNAIDHRMVDELHGVCALLEAAPRPLVITGRDGVFAGGADIRELKERGRDDALAGINSGVFDRVAKLPMPTVAAVQGPALGGGAELAYACDFRLATTGSRFGNPEARLGIVAAAGASWRLQGLVGVSVAKQMLLAGRTLSGEEALSCGLVMQLVEETELLAASNALIDQILKADPLALRLTKLSMSAPVDAHPVIDNIAQAITFESAEKRARMTAFLDRPAR